MICNKCGETFKGEHWQRFCDNCYVDVKKVTTSWKDTHHPSFVYEKDHPVEVVERCAPELAQPFIDELAKMFKVEEVEIKEEILPALCEHVFKKLPYGNQCDCGMSEHQFLYSVQVEPRTKIFGTPQ